ncbi:MAG: DUF2914 domain-containing protein [Deltaproteobacteria bacterium]|nr:DUF2914 domain-containing protein [Deltaproteobacteria bacterium]
MASRRARPLLFALVLLGGLLAPAAPALADQLQCNTEADARRAVDLLVPGSFLIDFCSLCESKVQVVRVAQANVIEDCEWEVEVRGTVLASSRKSFQDGKGVKDADYERVSIPYAGRLDLAYAYVEKEENVFGWMGGVLGLEADVNVATLRLPADIYDALGGHSRPSVGQSYGKAAPSTPDADTVQAVWEYYYRGQGGPPVLVRLTPCLKVDTAKASDTRYECIEPLRGAAKKGDTVSAWMSWLVPQGESFDDVMVQWAHDGVVRSTQDLEVNGKGFRYRTYLSKTLSKPGRWEVIVRRGTTELGRAEIDVD